MVETTGETTPPLFTIEFFYLRARSLRTFSADASGVSYVRRGTGRFVGRKKERDVIKCDSDEARFEYLRAHSTELNFGSGARYRGSAPSRIFSGIQASMTFC